MLRRAFISLLAAVALGGIAQAQVPRAHWAPEQRRDHDRDRDGDREVPFSEIQRELRSRYGGQLLDVSKRGDAYIVSWIDGDGRRLVIEVDARTGRTISVRGR